MYIKDNSDYRFHAYCVRTIDPAECDDPAKASEAIKRIKRAMREYTHREPDNRRIVKDNGIDGYVELVRLPDDFKSTEQAGEFFEEFFTYHPAPSMYDCTGRPFTAWYKVFKRNGGFYAYHSVGFDV